MDSLASHSDRSLSRTAAFLRVPDLVYPLLSFLFCLAAVNGTLLLSPLGCGIDTDLQNYAQILEAARHPQAMAHDPMTPLLALDPGVPNLLTNLAGLFPDSANAAVAILKAGGLAVWLQLVTWYALGRYLFTAPSLAIVLSLVASITFYWAFGTFWGATHAEPVPRIFYNSCLALYLLLACRALSRPALRPVLALLAGLGIFVHSVSALMGGAVFLTAFFLLPIRDDQGRFRPGRHLANLALCAVLFALPVLLFLGLRVPLASVAPEDLPFWAEVFALRFARDWSTIWTSLFDRLAIYTFDFPLIPLSLLALACLFGFRHLLPARCREMVVLLPALLAGLVAGCLAVWLEIALAGSAGRLPMSQEMLRGTRFLIPFCLLALACTLSLPWARLPRPICGLIALIVAGLILTFSPDRQVMAARFFVTTSLSLPCEQAALDERGRNAMEVEALEAIRRVVPPHCPVFSPDDDALAVRYVLHHPLEPVHKDGNILYYARAREKAEQWLAAQRALKDDPACLHEVWTRSGAPCLLVRRGSLEHCPSLPNSPGIRTLYENREWILLANF